MDGVKESWFFSCFEWKCEFAWMIAWCVVVVRVVAAAVDRC